MNGICKFGKMNVPWNTSLFWENKVCLPAPQYQVVLSRCVARTGGGGGASLDFEHFTGTTQSQGKNLEFGHLTRTTPEPRGTLKPP